MTRAEYDEYDLIVCMDNANLRNLRRLTGGDPEGKISLVLDHCGREGQEVADPWYTGDFTATWNDLSEGLAGLLKELTEISFAASQNFAPSGAKQIASNSNKGKFVPNLPIPGGALPRKKHLSRSGVCESPPVRRLVGLSARSEAPVSIAPSARGTLLALKGRRGLSSQLTLFVCRASGCRSAC